MLAIQPPLRALAEQVRDRKRARLLEGNRSKHADLRRELALQPVADFIGLQVATSDFEDRCRGIRRDDHVELGFALGRHHELSG